MSTTHLKRCKSCNQWTDGNNPFCEHCGYELDKVYKEEQRIREAKGDHRVPILQIHPDDEVWIKIIKKPVQIVQLILYAIVAFLIYLSTVFAH